MPSETPTSSSEEFRARSNTGTAEPWQRRARQLKLRINLAWWLQSFIRLWLGVILGCSAVILLLRTFSAPIATPHMLYVAAGLTLAAAVLAYHFSAKKFIDQRTALARLDDAHHLHTALSTAEAGIGSWPISPRNNNSPLHWRGQRIAALIIIPLAVLALAAWLPINAATDKPSAASRPAVWEQIESALSEKVLEELADPERVEALQREMEKLNDRAPGDWFDHTSLETSDRVTELLSAGLANMEQNLSAAANLAPKLAELADQNGQPLDDETREKLARQMEEALQQLQNQPLGLNEEARKKLMQAAPNALKNMDPAQAQQMAEQLKDWAEKAGQARQGMGEGGQAGDKPLWEQMLDQQGQPGEGEGQGQGQGQGNQPGQGGIQRGPGEAPMNLNGQQSQQNGKTAEGIDGDIKEFQPGQKIGETLDNREVERIQIGPRAGGDAAEEGKGGDRVWRQQLTPSEQNLLENYFD